MKIRRATKKDFPAIRRLIAEHPATLMQKHLPKPGEFFVATEGDDIVGCCALEVYSKRLAEIRSLAVTKRMQGNGIATALVQRCMQTARKKKIYEVLAISSSDRFFAKYGFHTFNKEKFALLNIIG